MFYIIVFSFKIVQSREKNKHKGNFMRLLNFIFGSMLCFCSIEADYPQRYEGIIKAERGEFLNVVQRFLPNDPIIVEAGAHYGTDTIRFVEMWPNSTIISFEPNPGAFSKLVNAVWDLKNVMTVPIALSTYDGEAILQVCYGTTGDQPIFEGASSLLEPSDYMAIHYQGPKVVVPCRILDHWCEDNHVKAVDFMWLDMEGMELQMLRSSPNILKTVKVILTETNFQEFRKGMTQYSELKTFLEASGFILLCHTYAEGFQGDAVFIRFDAFP